MEYIDHLLEFPGFCQALREGFTPSTKGMFFTEIQQLQIKKILEKRKSELDLYYEKMILPKRKKEEQK